MTKYFWSHLKEKRVAPNQFAEKMTHNDVTATDGTIICSHRSKPYDYHKETCTNNINKTQKKTRNKKLVEII